MQKTALIFFFLISCIVPATFAFPTDSTLINYLKQHIYYLASDKLSGRNTGSKGEKQSYKYLIGQYKKMGLLPKGEKGYLQRYMLHLKTLMKLYTGSLTV